MIEVHFDGDDVEVLISGEQAEILDASEDCVLAQCSLPDLATEPSQRLPHELRLQLQSEDGFGTYLFHELAARGETPAAFGRRCIPADCVAPSSNIPDILGRRALSSGCLAALGATLEFHHGLLGRVRLTDAALERKGREGRKEIRSHFASFATSAFNRWHSRVRHIISARA